MAVRFVATFASDVTAPARARAWLTERIDELRDTVRPSLADDLRLVVTELLTNAVRAGSTPVRLLMRLDGGLLTVEVTDDYAGAIPELRAPSLLDVGGRGLHIVAALSRDWGWRTGTDGSKTVWAELDTSEQVDRLAAD